MLSSFLDTLLKIPKIPKICTSSTLDFHNKNSILLNDDDHELDHPLLALDEGGCRQAELAERGGNKAAKAVVVAEKGVNIKVKILMTKEEAARLLSKCDKERGTLEFQDVARSLVQIPAQRISIVSSSESGCTYNYNNALHLVKTL